MGIKRFKNAIRKSRQKAGHAETRNVIPACLLDGTGATVYYVGDLTRSENCQMVKTLLDNKKTANTVVAFEGEIKPSVREFMVSIKDKIEFYHVPDSSRKSFADHVYQYLYKNYGWFASPTGKYYQREADRLFNRYNIREIHLVNTELFERIEIIGRCKSRTILHRIPMLFYRKLVDVFFRHPERIEKTFCRFDEMVEYEKDFCIDIWDNHYCSGVDAQLGGLKFSETEGGDIVLRGHLVVKTENKDACLGKKLIIGSTIHEKTFEYPINAENLKTHRNRELIVAECDVDVSIPVDEVLNWYNINLPMIQIETCGHVINVPFLASKGKNILKQNVRELGSSGYAFEIREDYRHLRFVIKEAKITDLRLEKIRLGIAFVCSIITFWNKPVLLYEKYCRKYEESASVLFEKLIDEGYKNVRFVLNAESEAMKSVKTEYRKYIVKQFSFSHYYNMFAAGSIFSSEALGHALEKGTASGLFKTFVLDGSKNYVFLQHGVMYMVALSSEQRNFFRKGEGAGKHRVVVSSELEAAHFTENTNYERCDIYNCGLIKFDRSVLDKNADKILVMLTWRPWEFVTGMACMNETDYYKMLHRIVDAVPAELKDKLIVMPHPLIIDQVKLKKDDPVWRYFVTGKTYDELLRKTKLLITDYSSISYDAFYRGSNIIFDWEEKDQCMKEYGENGHLMLTEELAFGDVCYDSAKMESLIVDAYTSSQRQKYIDNYSKIVEFHDGNNSSRFIEMAKKDGLL